MEAVDQLHCVDIKLYVFASELANCLPSSSVNEENLVWRTFLVEAPKGNQVVRVHLPMDRCHRHLVDSVLLQVDFFGGSETASFFEARDLDSLEGGQCVFNTLVGGLQLNCVQDLHFASFELAGNGEGGQVNQFGGAVVLEGHELLGVGGRTETDLEETGDVVLHVEGLDLLLLKVVGDDENFVVEGSQDDGLVGDDNSRNHRPQFLVLDLENQLEIFELNDFEEAIGSHIDKLVVLGLHHHAVVV